MPMNYREANKLHRVKWDGKMQFLEGEYYEASKPKSKFTFKKDKNHVYKSDGTMPVRKIAVTRATTLGPKGLLLPEKK